jgi:hypothetical protein
LAIVVIALGMRVWWQYDAPLQQDEFGPLYAIAERQVRIAGAPPTASDPLVPVPSLEEVRERSVLPYGMPSVFAGLLSVIG